jgi:hypothetical protein
VKKAYHEQLCDIAEQYPNIHAVLSAREYRRGITMRLLSDEFAVILGGIEQLVVYLHNLHAVYQEHAATKKIAFLVMRIIEDYETSLDAALAGVYYISNDRMRDVLEIELLLKEFVADTEAIDAWLSADGETIHRRFSPNSLRQRLANRSGVKPSELPGAGDYKAHSQLLHLAPWHARGVLLSPDGVSVTTGKDAFRFLLLCLGEMFYHSGAVIDALHGMLSKMCHIDYGEKHFEEHLSDFKAAYEFIMPLTQRLRISRHDVS